MEDYVVEKSAELIKDDREAYAKHFWATVLELSQNGCTRSIAQTLMRSIPLELYERVYDHKLFAMSDEEFLRNYRKLHSDIAGFKHLSKKPNLELMSVHMLTWFKQLRVPQSLIWLSGDSSKNEKFKDLFFFESSNLTMGWQNPL